MGSTGPTRMCASRMSPPGDDVRRRHIFTLVRTLEGVNEHVELVAVEMDPRNAPLMGVLRRQRVQEATDRSLRPGRSHACRG